MLQITGESYYYFHSQNSSTEKLYLNKKVWLLRKVDHFFPVSNYTRERLLKLFITWEKITLFKNGMDQDYFCPVEINIPTRGKYRLSVRGQIR